MRTGLILGTSIAAIAITAAAPLAETVIGAASAVKNDVRVRKPGGGLARPVALRQRIALGDSVQTGAKSQLQVLLLDKSVFTVGANARVTIDRFVYDPNRSSSMSATVSKGAFRFMSGKRGSSGSSIKTPVASIGIRGTIVEGVVGPDAALIATSERGVGRGVQSDPETATLVVLRGPGRATQGGARPGAIDVSAGGRTATADRPLQALYIPREGAAPIGPFPISNSGLMQLQAILAPSGAARLGIEGPEDNIGTRPFDPNETFVAPPPPPTRPRGRPPGGAFDEDAPPNFQGPGNLPTIPSVDRPRTRTQDQPQQPQSAPTPTPTPSSYRSPTPNAAPTPTPTRTVPSPNAGPTPTPSYSPTPRPSPTPSPILRDQVQSPQPQPSPRPSPTPTPKPTYKGPN